MLELTPRQIEVVQHASQGHSVKESARLSSVSPDTIKDHRRLAVAKLGSKTIAEAVAIAMRKGLIT